MANYVSSYTGAQHDTYATASQIVNLIYPVGSIYISVNGTNPQTLFGGTWVQIQDTFLLSAGTKYTAGNTGGKASYTADDMPAHTHERGTMEITGHVGASGWYGEPGASPGMTALSGAFYQSTTRLNLKNITNSNGWVAGGWGANFAASRAWTGETSQSGTNENATIMPPYLTVYMWKRTG